MVREARKEDLDALLRLYLFLHEDSIPEQNAHLEKTWNQIIEDPNHHLIVNEIDGQIVSSCVCIIIPNLTRNVVCVKSSLAFFLFYDVTYYLQLSP